MRPHFLVCNADESEPGTFKDRILMEGDPFAVLEAMTIAALATGCERGFIYVRGEYPLAFERLETAAEQARTRGLLWRPRRMWRRRFGSLPARGLSRGLGRGCRVGRGGRIE